MEDQDVLQHLLEIESQATILVNDAQAEAGRRIKETEEKNRSRYDMSYRSLVEDLDREYGKNIKAVREEYRLELDAYRENLDRMPVNEEGFSALASLLLFGEK
jgi:vacuolar-type H+-ATPase subunit H